jgi:hypothetical protein
MIENTGEEIRLVRERPDGFDCDAAEIHEPGKPVMFSRDEDKRRNGELFGGPLPLPSVARRAGSIRHANPLTKGVCEQTPSLLPDQDQLNELGVSRGQSLDETINCRIREVIQMQRRSRCEGAIFPSRD